MSELTIQVEEREERGKNAMRRLRASGFLPAVVYGAGKDTVPIKVERRAMLELLRTSTSEHAVFLLKLGGSDATRHAMIKEMQVDAVTRRIEHIDFQRVRMDVAVTVAVPVELIGTPTGVRNEGGVIDFVTREVLIEALPGDLPDTLTLDVDELHMGQHLEVKDIVFPGNVTLADDAERTIVSVVAPRAIIEEEPEEDELLEADVDEPEVIGREGEEGEGEEKAGEE